MEVPSRGSSDRISLQVLVCHLGLGVAGRLNYQGVIEADVGKLVQAFGCRSGTGGFSA